MFNSLWTYPWDLIDLGIENSLKEIKATGLDGISLASSYHAGRFLQARSPRRKAYFPEDGTLYFTPNPELYRHLLIQPETAPFVKENQGYLDELFDKAERYGLKISAWTVALHNSRIGRKYPEVAVRNAYGDVYYYNQCPSNPAARDYVKALITDLTAQYPYYALELESLNFMGFFHEYHHEKDGVGLTAKDDFLLSLCFCDSCKRRAQKAGLDISRAQKAVKQWIAESCSRESPQNDDQEFLARGLEYFSDTLAVYEYLKWRSTVVTSLAEELQALIPQRTKLYFLSLLTPDRSWLFGVDFKQISRVNDGIVVCCYDTDAKQVGLNMEKSVAEVADTTDILTGLRVFYPEVHDEAELVDKVKEAYRAGTQGYIFYNYGLIPQPRMAWIQKSIEAVTSK
jgi:hypothetical protein